MTKIENHLFFRYRKLSNRFGKQWLGATQPYFACWGESPNPRRSSLRCGMAAHSVRMLETDSRKRAQESALETLLLRQISFRPYSYSLMSRELALLMICPVASLMKSTAMFSTSVPLEILYIPPYRYLRYRGNYHPGGCTAV